ncbi:hypothetical protein A3K86_07805 [Photobacterium jeanii]|uniref:Endonuclease/exonuclease/phosphatase domain-containing protein n=1 Tax=Photobacterium jeanii TaxID=858640 RepID=A0A178KNT4_9GAMM|nr:endonuclease/exonuclease/phosphatase family protein [Photobacterium jeanii]OAN18756.1 hypothetical protein A3K86_07805 [Photobacterium jeanii]PST86301.1 endonuclease/exonuclease/phosphatase family protein [Photobacterium jeanii]
MARLGRYVLIAVGLVAVGGMSFSELSFDVTATPEVATDIRTTMPKYSYHCAEQAVAKPLDIDGQLKVTVWNIYKQQRENWQQALKSFSQQSQLVLLQEANLTLGLADYLKVSSWQVTMANAFKFLDTSAGVMNLSRTHASQTCAYLSMEPWLGLPKSALLARFALSNGQQLAVVNLHGVNFTLGVDEYNKQMAMLEQVLMEHQGPVILAGDFNTWRQARMEIVEGFAQRLGLKEVDLQQDQRIRIFDQPLDHLYYRGLKLETAEAPETDASDHNPILATFRLTAS